jgi:hypothetical protein
MQPDQVVVHPEEVDHQPPQSAAMSRGEMLALKSGTPIGMRVVWAMPPWLEVSEIHVCDKKWEISMMY